jgi:hypothetical protein
MKAIITKYHGPTNTRGSRITASDEDGNRVTIPYPYDLSGEAVHRKAAEALCDKMGWHGELADGSIKGGYVFVFTNSNDPKQSLCSVRYFVAGGRVERQCLEPADEVCVRCGRGSCEEHIAERFPIFDLADGTHVCEDCISPDELENLE